MAQWIKDPALSLLRLGSQLWCGFDNWPRNFCRLPVWYKKKNREIKLSNYLYNRTVYVYIYRLTLRNNK